MDRRKFFEQSGCALAATALAGTTTAVPQAQTQKPGPTADELHVGMVTYNLGRSWDLETLIKNCTQTKFEGVELRTTHAHGVEITLPPDKRSEIRKRYADSPVRLVGLGATCEYHSPDPAVLKKNIEETKAFARLAHDVGAEGVKVRPNGLTAGVPEEKTLEQIGLALRECGAFAADYGVPIRLEIHGRDTCRIPRIRKILEHAQHGNVWACWNSNSEDLLDGGLESNFNLVKDRLGLVHLKDLSDEQYPYRQFIRLLQGIRFSGYCLAEIPESSDPIRVMHYFRALFRAYQGI